jgi:hypothetical protein
MQSAMTVLTVVGGLVFSVSCALLVEEVIFGGLFKIFFQVPGVPVRVESGVKSQQRRLAGTTRNKQL